MATFGPRFGDDDVAEVFFRPSDARLNVAGNGDVTLSRIPATSRSISQPRSLAGWLC